MSSILLWKFLNGLCISFACFFLIIQVAPLSLNNFIKGFHTFWIFSPIMNYIGTRLITVSASLQCAYSIFHNDFLGRILFKKLPKKWTFDLKMRILFKKLLKKRTFDKVRSQFKMHSVMTRIRYVLVCNLQATFWILSLTKLFTSWLLASIRRVGKQWRRRKWPYFGVLPHLINQVHPYFMNSGQFVPKITQFKGNVKYFTKY